MEFNYQELASRTATSDYKTVIQRFGDQKALEAFLLDMQTQSILSSELDEAKKYFYYGKQSYLESLNEIEFESGELVEKTKERLQSKQMVDLVHGIVGIITESGELLENLITSIKENKEIDNVNLIEEMGDIFWYMALMANSINTNFEKIQLTNINKLKKRYPYGFTDYDALNRDLTSERKNLEGSIENQ